jgi:large conductance mechanosensitive channel
MEGLVHGARTLEAEMLKGFRDFIARGNVIDLAVAVVLGAAFGAVVSAFADDFIGGILGAIGGSPDFGDAGVEVNDSKIVWGSTITALIQFLIVAAAIYFVVVVPMGKLQSMRDKDADAETPAPSDEAKLLTEIRDLLAQRGDDSPSGTNPSRPT